MRFSSTCRLASSSESYIHRAYALEIRTCINLLMLLILLFFISCCGFVFFYKVPLLQQPIKIMFKKTNNFRESSISAHSVESAKAHRKLFTLSHPRTMHAISPPYLLHPYHCNVASQIYNISTFIWRVK